MLDVEIQWSILVPHGNKPRSQHGQTLFSLGKVIAGLCIVLLLVIGFSIVTSGTDGKTTPATVVTPGDNGYYSPSGGTNIPPNGDTSYRNYPPTTPTPLPEIKLSLGQTATSSDSTMQVTVYSAQRIASTFYDIDRKQIKYPMKGNYFIIVDVEGKAIGPFDQMFSSSSFIVRDSNTNEYTPTFYAGDDALQLTGNLRPGENTRGKLLFEIPSTAKDLKIHTKFFDYPEQRASWPILSEG